ncbi:hypothetical protein D3C72_2316360 [compost metagenome]
MAIPFWVATATDFFLSGVTSASANSYGEFFSRISVINEPSVPKLCVIDAVLPSLSSCW